LRGVRLALEFLFCLVLRWSQPETIRKILKRFESSNKQADLGDVQLKYPSYQGYTQPDIRIESPAAVLVSNHLQNMTKRSD
jgi:hypothetical protein